MKIDKLVELLKGTEEVVFRINGLGEEVFGTEEVYKCIEPFIDKQIAVRPLGFDNGGAEDYEEWAECPKCSESIPEYTLENETECYCLGCGQFLNWSEEE